MQDEPFCHHVQEYMEIVHWMKENPRLIAGFSTRLGGISDAPYTCLNVGFHVHDKDQDVLKNRMILAEKLQFPLEDWVVAEQIHKANIKKVEKGDKGKGAFCLEDAIKGADGLYTQTKGILLVSLYADCTPLYFFSPNNEMIGLAHAGWRGTVARIGPKMVQLWNEEEKIELRDIQVVIGPCISQDVYQVDDLVISEVNKLLDPTDPTPYKKVAKGQYQLDLKALNYLLLLKAGLKPQQIKISQYCTFKNNDLFYSHRKESGKTGRMMSFIGYKNR